MDAKATKTSSKRAKKTRKEAPEPAETEAEKAPTPPPPTPEQSPATAPQVTYQNGLLSIRSDNSTLGAILAAVKTSTGATVDAPGSTANDRIATVLGPGDARDVLSSLLDNSKYDFILLGQPDRPLAVQKIILTAKASGPGTPAPAANMPRTATFRGEPTAPQPDADQELPDAEIPDEANQPEQPPEPPPANPDQADQQLQQNGEQQNNGQQNGAKSPEQLLQELQRMQQQQQQQQQQQIQQNLNPR